MAREDINTRHKRTKLKCFEEKGLQLTVAVLVVLTLLAGITLQMAVASVVSHYGFSFYVFTIFLIAGYAVIVIVFSLFFTYRLVGPFRRLEYEMKLILKGDKERRLTSRTEDDLHLRGFIARLNDFISGCSITNMEYKKFSDSIEGKLGEIGKELSKEKCDREKIKREVHALQREVREFGEKR